MLVQEKVQNERMAKDPKSTAKTSADLGVGVALWESSAGQWSMISCGCTNGYEAGPAPSEPASYEGQIVQKLCQPVSG